LNASIQAPNQASNQRGWLWASLIGLAWLASLVGLLALDLGALYRFGATAVPGLGVALLLGAVLTRSFLHTGLFIVAHDAMHGVLIPGSPSRNHRCGQLALALYAALPYAPCRAQHQLHHRAPGSLADPDFHPDPNAIAAWFGNFLGGYLSWSQMLQLLAGWAGLGLLSSLATASGPLNVLLFCTIPLLLSALQLFLFGTFLPHRAAAAPANRHHARSLDLPIWLSFLACYHFGYHWEHHEFPALAWFELPGSRCRSSGDRVPGGRR
jgi:beta-carotene ketolase (CrtW type)